MKVFEFPATKINRILKGTDFYFSTNHIYYFETSENDFGTKFKNNIHSINNLFVDKGFELIVLPDKIDYDLFNGYFRYFLPHIKVHNNESNNSFLGDFVENLGYNDNANNFFCYLYGEFFYLIAIENNSKWNIILPIVLENIHYFKNENIIYFNDDCLFSPFILDEENFPLDEETKNHIDTIFKKLRIINNSGQFITVLPLLERYLEKYKRSNSHQLSTLYIDEDYRIFLKDYDKEVKLSHLTKSLYFLFLAKGQFHLEEIQQYQDALFIIYKHISHQENLEKMQESVQQLIANRNNELYVHFSRIKSAFCKCIDNSIAENYYIRGYKNSAKSISLRKLSTNIYEHQEKWFPNDKRFSTHLQDITLEANMNDLMYM